MSSLAVFSLNVRGMRNLVKRKAIFLFCRKYFSDFYFIQETHASESDFQFWKSQWGNDMWMSYGSNHSAGVAILKGKFRGKIIKSYSHSLGRWIILIVEFNQQYFVLGNIYATNSVVRNKSLLQDFEEKIRNILDSFSDAKLILGGDYNSVWDNKLDCIPPRGNSLNHFNELHNLCLGLDLIDIWRVKNANKQEFTWCSGDRSKQSRIDFWLISSVLQNQVSQVTIETSVLTDHKVIYLVIVLNGNIGNNIRTRTHWKLNKAILENELFKKVKNIILSCLNNARSSNKFGANWEYMKYLIRKQAIVRGKLIAQFKRTREEQVIK